MKRILAFAAIAAAALAPAWAQDAKEAKQDDSYLPLADGNTWEYTLAGKDLKFIVRVNGKEEGGWSLETGIDPDQVKGMLPRPGEAPELPGLPGPDELPGLDKLPELPELPELPSIDELIPGLGDKLGDLNLALADVMNGGAISKKALVVDKDGIKAVKITVLGREAKPATPIVQFKLPVKNGDTWSHAFTVDEKETTVTFKVVGEEAVTVPAGKFTAVKVEEKSTVDTGLIPLKTKRTAWYAKGVGIVRETFAITMFGKDMTLADLELSRYSFDGKKGGPKAEPKNEPKGPQMPKKDGGK
jgi:hypothetical protein